MSLLLKSVQKTQTQKSDFAAHWPVILSDVESLFQFSPETIEKLAHSRIAKLTAAIPFIAGCRNPVRIAVSHVMYVLSAEIPSIAQYFLHSFADNENVFTRLERISHFPDGDPLIIQRGMNLLTVIMISDYQKDKEHDKKIKKYNPLENGVWNADEKIEKLENEIKSVPCPEMDNIITVDEAKEDSWVF